MNPFLLAPYQLELIERPVETRIFLEGQAGSGKTTVGVQRMLALLEQGIPASQILVLVPQRTLAAPYQSALRTATLSPGGQVSIQTVGGLARRSVELFWPLIAAETGFARPDLPPSFLTLETALYYMAYLVRPLLEEGLFDSVTIERNRIYSQILDNLNKAAIVGFPYTEISQRLRSSWLEDTAQAHIFEDAQRCANIFREYCLQNNLLDFSLQVEIFCQFLWPLPACRDYLQDLYRHLIYDNIEEDTPVAHDLLYDWLPKFDSALLIYDQDAGYRRFLGADPDSAYNLLDHCDERHIFTDSLTAAPALHSFCAQLGQALDRPISPEEQAKPQPRRSEDLTSALAFPDRTCASTPRCSTGSLNRWMVCCKREPHRVKSCSSLRCCPIRFVLPSPTGWKHAEFPIGRTVHRALCGKNPLHRHC
jgi:superfamily I DNA/RNA helicase